jgi:hypothetical protein
LKVVGLGFESVFSVEKCSMSQRPRDAGSLKKTLIKQAQVSSTAWVEITLVAVTRAAGR